jgi:predicted DNA-binding transcriptional regulator AlpA
MNAERAEVEMMTVRQLALRLGVAEKSVWRWHYLGRLPGRCQIGRCVRYSAAAIERAILGGSVLLPARHPEKPDLAAA